MRAAAAGSVVAQAAAAAVPPRCRPAPLAMLPPEGGETAFASGLVGYELLDAAERAQVESLGAVHSWCDFMKFLEARDPQQEKVSGADCAAKPDVMPLVRTHPITGRRSLYLNPKNGLRIVKLADGRPARRAQRRTRPQSARRVRAAAPTATRGGRATSCSGTIACSCTVAFDAAAHERLIYRAEFPESRYFFSF